MRPSESICYRAHILFAGRGRQLVTAWPLEAMQLDAKSSPPLVCWLVLMTFAYVLCSL